MQIRETTGADRTDGIAPFVEAVGLAKSYGGAQALKGIDVTIARGDVHALVGENGAGKSTLGKVIAGIVTPDAGSLVIEGERVHRMAPRDAIARGITVIEQELNLLHEHTVAENVFFGTRAQRRGMFARRDLRDRFAALDAGVGFGLDPDARLGTLRIAEQQKVEILRALARDARLIVMDEPTAALTRDEADRLLAVVRMLRDRGRTIVYVSHSLRDVLDVADTVTVLKDGAVVRTGPAADETTDSLVTAMLGRTLTATFPPKPAVDAAAPTVLAVRRLDRPGVLHDITLDVRAGEIVGLAGLIGSGRSEVAHAIFGADPHARLELELDGRPVAVRSPRDAIANGIALLPESRKDQGLLMGQTVGHNLTFAHLPRVTSGAVVRRDRERRAVDELIARLDIRPPDASAPVRHLSGGNQQKVLFGKWLMQTPRLLIADEPTRGVDVGAKRGIYDLLVELAARGTAVLLISSEIEEIQGLAHRILVMRQGRIAARLDGAASEDELMRAALVAEGDSHRG